MHGERDGDEDGVDDQGADAAQAPAAPQCTGRGGTDLTARMIASHMPTTNAEGKHFEKNENKNGTRIGHNSRMLQSRSDPESKGQTRTVKEWSRI